MYKSIPSASLNRGARSSGVGPPGDINLTFPCVRATAPRAPATSNGVETDAASTTAARVTIDHAWRAFARGDVWHPRNVARGVARASSAPVAVQGDGRVRDARAASAERKIKRAVRSRARWRAWRCGAVRREVTSNARRRPPTARR
jgi:hypothetical protein